MFYYLQDGEKHRSTAQRSLVLPDRNQPINLTTQITVHKTYLGTHTHAHAHTHAMSVACVCIYVC